ncbi:unnamed protein product [Caenorhabditis sp. 36 PRJEB53466]|nr:unnamed protein product [Caenorhabditis sp. 36 PRJEB53466]
MRWDIVTLSLSYGIDPVDIDSDVLHLQNLSFPDCEEILVVNDASEDVGSGGSALNALIRTAERLCYRKRIPVLTESALQDANILLILVSDLRAIRNVNENGVAEEGDGYVFDTFLSHSIRNATAVAERTEQKGVWIIGSDSLWKLEKQSDIFDLPQNGITGFTFIGSRNQLKDHGWYRTEKTGKKTGNGWALQKVTGMEFDSEVAVDSTIASQEKSAVILGFLYMPLPVASAFLSLHSQFPVAATTYLGVDSNITPLKLSLFFDFMLATCIGEDEFVANRLGTRVKVSDNVEDRTNARKQIFEKLRSFQATAAVLEITEYKYKEFPNSVRDYTALLHKLDQPTHLLNADVKRSIRSELSVRRLQEPQPADLQPHSIMTSFRSIIQQTDTPEVHLRMVFSASLALSIASDGKGGLRNGPAKNLSFAPLMHMESGKMQTYLLAMIDEILKNWMNEPSRMIRAARHLETAAQNYIRNEVDSICASRTLQLKRNEMNVAKGVKVCAPARIDFFGGWLDTPPIFFSMDNAAVVNMSVKLDGMNPISCWVTKIDEPVVEVCQDGIRIQIKNEEELFYVHDKPTETGSLVCASILALNFRTLSDFFSALNCKGLRIETKSELPHGSGLGTSSTIAAAILKAFAALGAVMNTNRYTLDEIIVHTVLRVEQIMTTGGGWQDQIGSLYPGLKKCYYVRGAGDENRIAVKEIPLAASVVRLLEERLLLVYTGKTRLAKNLLQEVIRNFFTCPLTKTKLSEMAERVEEFAERIRRADLPVKLLEQYHSTKNFMTCCEPPIVTALLEQLKKKKMIKVGWAAGAGGGGFVYLWLTKRTERNQVEQFISSTDQFSNMTCHSITIQTVCPFTVETFE